MQNLLTCLFVPLILAQDTTDIFEDCGVSKGCYMVPPGCETTTNQTCAGIFTWKVDPGGINFLLGGNLAAKNGYNYVAVGFSLDEYMGDDTVLACIGGSRNQENSTNDAEGLLMVAWNDRTSNYILYEASELILKMENFTIENNRMLCEGRWSFGGWEEIPMNQDRKSTQGFVVSIEPTGYHGSTTHSLTIHSTLDGDAFPWICADTINFCSPTGCGENLTVYKKLEYAHQSQPKRFVRQSIAVAHGLTMIASWWVLASSGILIARYGKSFNIEVCGSAIWFQLHRLFMTIAFLCVSAAFWLIYWQGGFRVYKCSTICGLEDYTKHVHAMLGTVIYSLFILQVLMGMLRPSKDSAIRPYFNMFHAFNGLLIWSGASSCIVLSVYFGKTGLHTFYGNYPYLLYAIIIILFIVIFAVCDWTTFKLRYTNQNPDSVENLKQKMYEHETASAATPWLIGLNAGWAIAGTIIVGIWLVSAMRKYGYQI